MQVDSVLNYAGDLAVELEEMEKLIPNEKEVDSAVTWTFMCQAVLTIRCC